MAEKDERLAEPGRNCWRSARASRAALIVDAADYFAHAHAAMLRAQRQILLIGWDFDTRIVLKPEGDDGSPDKLGAFLSWLARNRPDLSIHILKWDVGAIKLLGRGTTVFRLLRWAWSKQIFFKLDHAHPFGGCHHQKIVVIDDRIAFCGGIDMTADRWDTRAHHDHDHHRRRPNGFRYDPFHDVTTAVDGAAARALGELGRERWLSATGEKLPAPPPGGDAWPDLLRPDFRDVDVGIARTHPDYEGPEVREIERLWLAAIASARRSIYIEAQYLASRRIGLALYRRLEEPDGPEIVVVNPLTTKGWLEEQAMGTARAHIVKELCAADAGRGRFRIYTPRAARGTPIYVHAKVLVVDDRFLRIGSSNINNRSMGFDTECDVAIEASPDRPEMSARILALRDGLVAEHLDRTIEEVRSALAAHGGSLCRAIEDLRRRPGRTLAPLECPDPGDVGLLLETEILDPERPRRPWQALLNRVDWNFRRLRRRQRKE